jgi:probable phosphoglycerate mutase
MNIYFVRHGQTKRNEIWTYQDEYEPLSDIGLEQARMAAERARSLSIDMICASPMKRAVQTAGIIKEAIGKEIIYSDLLKENRRPSVMVGKRGDDPLAVEIIKECRSHNDDPFWHYSDEENFLEYKERGRKALEYLEGLPQENILVVSHSYLIKMLVLTMALGDLVSPDIFHSFADKFQLRNTGLTYCKKKSSGWSIEAFNDHRHLG